MILNIASKKKAFFKLLFFVVLTVLLSVNYTQRTYAYVEDKTPPTITNVSHYPTIPLNTGVVLINCTAYDTNDILSVKLYYRINEGDIWYNKTMNRVRITNSYNCTIGLFEADDMVEYYIVAIDNSSNHNQAVANNGGLYYSFTIGLNDISAPEITNVSFSPATPDVIDLVNIRCEIIDDFSEIAEVKLYFRLNGSIWNQLNFQYEANSTYKVIIGPFIANTFVEFYITAKDNSTNANLGINDNSGSFFSFTVILKPDDTTTPVTQETSGFLRIMASAADHVRPASAPGCRSVWALL